MKKQPGSIRSLGMTRIHMDQPLHDDIKALAEASNKTMVRYLRELVTRELQAGLQLSRSSEEQAAIDSMARNRAMVAEMAELRASYSKLELAFCWLMRSLGRKTPISPGIRKTIREMLARTGEQLNMEQVR